jgi:glycosyltransferase involved in cell wall biosynthesis
MNKDKISPDFLFETSWEVCNKVGGIYTVLSTRAHTLQQMMKDRLVFIGPDLNGKALPSDFKEDKTLFADWKKHALKADGLKVKVGRWKVPGDPIVILVDFSPFYGEKGLFYFNMWEDYRIDSSKGYGDYDESCMFALASAHVMESFHQFYQLENKNVVALFNEWMLAMGALYIKKNVPSIATMFTTHATSIGRSIAGNNKLLYAYMDGYNGDQMAEELNMQAKHAVEKCAAHVVDCFTTVSDITAIECTQLLDKQPDVVTTNGFEQNFVPAKALYRTKRAEARKALIDVAEKLTGCTISPDALLVSTSGRYEYKNKGIDVFIDAMNQVRTSTELNKEVVAFILVPGWVAEARADLKSMVQNNIPSDEPLQHPFITHWLHNMQEDKVLNFVDHCGFGNNEGEKLKIVFVPCYLDGKDGIFNKSYYDILIGMDVTIYPSYYEPWGYTPLESVAFGIPTITTNLAGFGLWALNYVSGKNIQEGVAVIDRTDFNYTDVVETIKEQILALTNASDIEINNSTKNCFKLAKKAEWKAFITHYVEAFDIALKKKNSRI